MTKAVVSMAGNRGRLYAVGDIHGCYNELVALEKRITDNCSRAGVEQITVISVGDLCDRGPDTKNVMERFVRGKNAGTHRVVLGNHEMFFLLAFWGIRPDLVRAAGIKPAWFHEILFRLFRQQSTNITAWRQNGGRIVFESYDADIDDPQSWDKIPLEHLRLIFEAPLAVVTPKTVISHALMGLGDLETLEAKDQGLQVEQKLAEAAVIRCLWERTLPEQRISATRRHVSGHTPLETVTRNPTVATIQIDTGAVYGRELTALDLNSLRATKVSSNFSVRRNMR